MEASEPRGDQSDGSELYELAVTAARVNLRAAAQDGVTADDRAQHAHAAQIATATAEQALRI